MMQYDRACIKQLESRQLAPHIYWATALARKAVVATKVRTPRELSSRSISDCLRVSNTEHTQAPLPLNEHQHPLLTLVQLPQALIISGESGSGKTVNTCHIIGFLCNESVLSALSAGPTLLSTRLRHSGALTEAFGNACTIRNNNSRLASACVHNNPHFLQSLCKVYSNRL
jgi:hypothetical protein